MRYVTIICEHFATAAASTFINDIIIDNGIFIEIYKVEDDKKLYN